MNNHRESGYSPEEIRREQEIPTEVEVINQLKYNIMDTAMTAVEGQGFSEVEMEYQLDNQPAGEHSEMRGRYVSRLENIAGDAIVLIVGRAEDIPIDEGGGNPLRFRAWQGSPRVGEEWSGYVRNQEFVVDWEYHNREQVARSVLQARVQAIQRALVVSLRGVPLQQ